MKKRLKILFVGESCVVHTTENKGNDVFHGARYNEPALIMKELIEKEGHEFCHIPCHRVHMDFPDTMEAISEYDIIILSDVGSNTMLLHPDTARFCRRTPNKLSLIAEFVQRGGGFGMIGGYMSFMGIDGRAKYRNTIMEELLPVNMLTFDDRVEIPEGAPLSMTEAGQYLFTEFPEEWPFVLGYNKVEAKSGSKVLVQYKEDPIITIGQYGEGKTFAYATDCTPHWAPPEMYQWEYYGKMWDRLFSWLCEEAV